MVLYADLVTLIQDYCENQEVSFVAHISQFVQFTEEDIYRRANLPLQSKNGTALTISGQNSVTLPTDFLSFDYLYVLDGTGAAQMLLNKETDFIYQAFPNNTYQTLPIYYSVRDNTTIILGPTPDQVYSLQFQYVYTPQSIVTASETWLGDNAQNALLYGSLVQAYVYMKGEPNILEYYRAMYQEALDHVKKLGEGDERSDQYRNPTPRPIPLGGGS